MAQIFGIAIAKAIATETLVPAAAAASSQREVDKIVFFVPARVG